MIDDTDLDLDSLIGQEEIDYYVVTERDVRRFCHTIGVDNNKLNYKDGSFVPPLICQMYLYSDAEIKYLKEDGSPAEINLPIPTIKTLGGSSTFEFGKNVRIGDKLKVIKKINNIYIKIGKSGKLYFIELQNEWLNQKEEFIAREIATYIQK